MAWTERYVTPTGGGLNDGTSEANAWTWAQAAAGYAAGQRLNIKAGTYSLSAIIQFTTHGTFAAPVWFRGYKTTIGDMDSVRVSQLVPGVDIPLISHTANTTYTLFSGQVQRYSNIAFTTTANNAPPVYARSAGSFFYRCRFANTSSGVTSSANAIRIDSQSYLRFVACSFESASTVHPCIEIFATGVDVIDCAINGGGDGVNTTGSVSKFDGCIISGQSGHGIDVYSSEIISINRCTLYDIAGDGVRFSAGTPSVNNASLIANNYFHTITGTAINSSGGTRGNIAIVRNAYYNVGAQIAGISEALQFNELTDSADEFVDAAGGDFTLESTSNATGGNAPFLFEKDGPTSYRDIGAIQAESAGGGGVSLPPIGPGGLVY